MLRLFVTTYNNKYKQYLSETMVQVPFKRAAVRPLLKNSSRQKRAQELSTSIEFTIYIKNSRKSRLSTIGKSHQFLLSSLSCTIGISFHENRSLESPQRYCEWIINQTRIVLLILDLAFDTIDHTILFDLLEFSYEMHSDGYNNI